VRGCFTTLLVGVALILVAGWFLLPPIAGAAISGGLGVTGFSAGEATVTVGADPPLELAALHADSVHVVATNATFHELTIASVDVTMRDVQLFDRTARTVSGTLTGLNIGAVGGDATSVGQATVEGSSSDLRISMKLSAVEASTLATSAVRAQVGVVPSKVTLAAPDQVGFVVRGFALGGRLAVDAAGGLVFRPQNGQGAFSAPIVIIAPGPGMPVRLQTVFVTPTGVTVTGMVDQSLFGG
jgi:hypothetical protein